MENEDNSFTDSFVARHTTDLTLRLELLFLNQNGLRHDQDTVMGAEVRKIEYSIAIKIERGTDIACLGLRGRPTEAGRAL